MSIIIRDFTTMVDSILDSIVASNVGITDTGRGSVIRTIVESIVAELDIQYFQLDSVYQSMVIDMASGDDLDRLVQLLAVTRTEATKYIGNIKFGRSTPATDDIPIPIGTIVSTRPDNSGNVIQFITTEYAQLSLGNTSVTVPMEAVVAGHVSVGVGMVSRMNDPIMGIDIVTNDSMLAGGADEETDDALRSRAKLALSGLGKATSNALESAISAIDDVTQVLVIDRARGVGTVDISVVCATMPVPSATQDAINEAIDNTKAAGVDVRIVYPTVKSVNVSVTMTYDAAHYTLEAVKALCGNAVLAYVSRLGVGSTFVVSQMERYILNASDGILDIVTVTPSSNITATTSEMIRVGTLTINGGVWYNG